MYLFIGSCLSGQLSGTVGVTLGQYSGAVDELRVYSRELSAGDVAALANP